MTQRLADMISLNDGNYNNNNAVVNVPAVVKCQCEWKECNCEIVEVHVAPVINEWSEKHDLK